MHNFSQNQIAFEIKSKHTEKTRIINVSPKPKHNDGKIII